MTGETVDMEQECEDAVFHLCDARERYPKKCAEEFAQCIKLTTQIKMAPIKLNYPEPLKFISVSDEQQDFFNTIISETKQRNEGIKIRATKLERILVKMKELNGVLEQLKREEECTINKILRKNERERET